MGRRRSAQDFREDWADDLEPEIAPGSEEHLVRTLRTSTLGKVRKVFWKGKQFLSSNEAPPEKNDLETARLLIANKGKLWGLSKEVILRSIYEYIEQNPDPDYCNELVEAYVRRGASDESILKMVEYGICVSDRVMWQSSMEKSFLLELILKKIELKQDIEEIYYMRDMQSDILAISFKLIETEQEIPDFILDELSADQLAAVERYKEQTKMEKAAKMALDVDLPQRLKMRPVMKEEDEEEV